MTSTFRPWPSWSRLYQAPLYSGRTWALSEETKNSDDREHIRKELAVIRAQRHKGLKILKVVGYSLSLAGAQGPARDQRGGHAGADAGDLRLRG